jgi:hypothetical protein
LGENIALFDHLTLFEVDFQDLAVDPTAHRDGIVRLHEGKADFPVYPTGLGAAKSRSFIRAFHVFKRPKRNGRRVPRAASEPCCARHAT